MRSRFSVCIPAYNRARHLPALLDSVFAQEYANFDVVICEDKSADREQIAAIVNRYLERWSGRIHYYENPDNLGYDANIRNLVEKAPGEFCFFMGNDDLMAPGALANVAGLLDRYPDAALVLKSYAWFDDVPEKVNQEVRYFKEERVFAAGKQAITVCFRRSGVISGYIINRDAAQAAATARFDGTLYYQMHLTASVLADRRAVFTPQVLVLCRNSEPPEFGNSGSEKGKYTPGRYTPEARLSMIGGALSIIQDLDSRRHMGLTKEVTRDYANYFYPYIKDQLHLPFRSFLKLYLAFGKLGFARYPLFHVYFAAAYLLGEKRFDDVTRLIRGKLGRSVQLGSFAR